jgi:hypothetical protein
VGRKEEEVIPKLIIRSPPETNETDWKVIVLLDQARKTVQELRRDRNHATLWSFAEVLRESSDYPQLYIRSTQ